MENMEWWKTGKMEHKSIEKSGFITHAVIIFSFFITMLLPKVKK